MKISESNIIHGVLRKARKGSLPGDSEVEAFLSAIANNPDWEAGAEKVSELRKLFRARAEGGRRIIGRQLDAFKILDPELAAEYELDIADRSEAASSAERKQKHLRMHNEIEALKPPADPPRKESCRYDLKLFGVTYCASLLNHEPPKGFDAFIRNIEAVILSGGRHQVRFPRGKGKSTWIKIAMIWAALYGHRRFMIAFAASGDNAESILNDVWNTLEKSDPIAADFPEVSIPIRAINGNPHKAKYQTYRNRPTNIYKGLKKIILPEIDGSDSYGTMIVCRGVKAGVRGLVKESMRPDFIFLDDVQTNETAESARATDRLERFVMKDAMGLSGHDRPIAALMADTPICEFDLSERFADKTKHPEWVTISTPLVISWPKRMDLVEQFVQAYYADTRDSDFTLASSREFYRAHAAELSEGFEVLDPLDGDGQIELDAFHHALCLYAYCGPEVFRSEYQMQPKKTQEALQITEALVVSKLNGYPRLHVPDECGGLFAFIDLNIVEGLRYVIAAFGSGRVATVIDYGKYPKAGRLYPKDIPAAAQQAAIARGLSTLIGSIAETRFAKSNGTVLRPIAICCDGGYETKTVARTLKTLGFPGINLNWSKGFNADKYRPLTWSGKHKDGVHSVGDHLHISESDNGLFIAYHSDFWFEEMQRNFLGTPLLPGSVSLYGSDKSVHTEFAREICNQKLADKARGQNGTEIWKWTKKGNNHYGDCLMGCHMLASLYRYYDTTDTIVAAAVRKNKDGVPLKTSALADGVRRIARALPVRAPRFRIK